MRHLQFLFSSLFLTPLSVFAAEADPLSGYIETVDQSGQGMTLWQIIQSGGVIMILLGLISVFMLTLVVYLFLKLQLNKLVPQDFAQDMIARLRQGNAGVVENNCAGQENLVARILSGGLAKKEYGVAAMKEGVEITARKEISNLWAVLSYLTDIAAVAPMLGLLGTVVGMIQAFNTIAFHASVVKPILLAGGVSKAMVTTAAGMVVAIVAMIFYSVLRFKIQNITNTLESLAGEITDVLSGSGKGGAR